MQRRFGETLHRATKLWGTDTPSVQDVLKDDIDPNWNMEGPVIGTRLPLLTTTEPETLVSESSPGLPEVGSTRH